MTAAALAALMALSACNKAATQADKQADKDSGPGITLSDDESKSMGIATAQVTGADYRGQLSGYGAVSGLDAIAQADADYATAAAAAAQSQAAAARAKSLSTGDDAAVSRETYESALAKAASDQAALALAERKTSASFGLNAPWRDPARHAAIMARLQSGRSVLVRVTFPDGAGSTASSHLMVSRVGGGKSWPAASVWDAPADPALPGRSLFALVDGSDLAQGERVIASLSSGGAQAGEIVPAAALVLGDAQAFVYRRIKPNTYLRTAIDISRPQGDGYFVSGGDIKPGDAVVTSGAGLLYSHEVNPSTEAD
jgi:multidrug efflux pump subunit AcrA (membrane-fusion protein)